MKKQIVTVIAVMVTHATSVHASNKFTEEQNRQICSDGADIFVNAMGFKCFPAGHPDPVGNARAYVAAFKQDTRRLIGENGIAQFIQSGLASANQGNCSALEQNPREIAQQVTAQCISLSQTKQ